MRQIDRAAIEEDSVVNGDSRAEYVILHSDRRFLRRTHKHATQGSGEKEYDGAKNLLQAREGETKASHYGLFVLSN